MKTNKTSLSLALAVFGAALLASSGFAAATEYTVQSLSLANSTAITVMHPVERQITVAIFPGRRVWSPQDSSAGAQEDTVQHGPSGNGGQISFFAPNP